LHCPRANDDLRLLSPDRSDGDQRCWRSERHFNDPQPALKQRTGKRHRVLFALDRQDGHDGNAVKQGVHAFPSGWCEILLSAPPKCSPDRSASR